VRMLDLFCGRFGWSRAFAARGWECVGVDLVEPPEIPQGCTFIKADILGMGFEDLLWKRKVRRICELYGGYNGYETLGEFDFICASSPCEGFSTMQNFHPPAPYPELGIKLFNHTRAICEASGVPYVMENVAGAGKYVGRAVSHCGSYYLWGTGVPAILPQGINKGMTELAMGLREHKGKPGWDVRHGKRGQTPTELVATIPPELANCVADYAERLLEQKELTR
jgi:hypothetical protein